MEHTNANFNIFAYSKLHIDRLILKLLRLASLFTLGAVQTGFYLPNGPLQLHILQTRNVYVSLWQSWLRTQI